MFQIKNTEYLEYDVLKFQSAFAYFTKAGKLYQIVLQTIPSSPLYQKYNAFKQRLIYLFGSSDNEYTYEPKENFFQPLSISWGSMEGENLRIQAYVIESAKNTAAVHLSIFNKKLNAESNKEIIESSEGEVVPKI